LRSSTRPFRRSEAADVNFGFCSTAADAFSPFVSIGEPAFIADAATSFGFSIFGVETFGGGMAAGSSDSPQL
jgi:hypothetical protein